MVWERSITFTLKKEKVLGAWAPAVRRSRLGRRGALWARVGASGPSLRRGRGAAGGAAPDTPGEGSPRAAPLWAWSAAESPGSPRAPGRFAAPPPPRCARAGPRQRRGGFPRGAGGAGRLSPSDPAAEEGRAADGPGGRRAPQAGEGGALRGRRHLGQRVGEDPLPTQPPEQSRGPAARPVESGDLWRPEPGGRGGGGGESELPPRPRTEGEEAWGPRQLRAWVGERVAPVHAELRAEAGCPREARNDEGAGKWGLGPKESRRQSRGDLLSR